MIAVHPPEIKRYMDKKLQVFLTGSRKVTGVLMGFDPYMNLVIDDAVEISKYQKEPVRIGMVVIRGNCITRLQLLENAR